ncbi:ABC transporter substrate-binding protein [Kallotenue papyrolyticum]|uniref:ABC transporter substrate-binding protein n=1 Tax=Kallotenue papyrolyticum TaxID=1325125 RepID=UPI000492743D|nr:ABC transporter substrate-binding protein [Kallotenue papyrolyticum]
MTRVLSSPAVRLVCLLLLLTLIVSGCGGGGGAAQPEASPATSPASAASPQSEASPQPSPAADAGQIIFLSTQFKPVEEAERMRNVILANFAGQVEFIPEDGGPFNDRIRAETQSGRVTISLLGGLHGDFAPFVRDQLLEDLTPLVNRLSERGFPEQFVELSRFGTEQHYYVPWMQATYIMVANKKALEHLPEGADINALTYDQLRQWGANLQQATGERKLGFPAGPKGLMHRFFQGYLYPSFTGSAGVVGFKTPEAVAMWNAFKDLWQYVNPRSTNYEFMQEPLLAEEVWVAWDHTARLIEALRQRPNDFVAFPAPAGPSGRGFMPVIAGLAIPKGAPNRAGAEQLIDYLTQPEQQITTLRENAFFPVIDVELPQELDPGIRLEAEAVQAQSAADDALPSLLPVGLGERGGEFNKVYLDTFQQVVLNNQPAEQVLAQQAQILQQIMNDTGARCWPPDPASEGPCQVK